MTSAIGLVGNLATDTVEVKASWWAPVTWTATVGLLLLQACSAPQNPERAVGRAVRALREAVRRLRQPLPLRVMWSSTTRPVAAAREVVLDEPGVTWRERPLEGMPARSPPASGNRSTGGRWCWGPGPARACWRCC